MADIQVGVKNRSNNPLPEYATEGAAGMDVRAHLPWAETLQPGERSAIPTGLFLAIPEGYEAQIRPRSGLALKSGITVLNSPGTIDSDYRGEVKIILANLGDDPYSREPGDRIAQMVFQPVTRAVWQVQDELPETKRGDGGFGHTGV